ncbi:hypothetical protein CDD82_7257 [Ophiocordyceps australis]|uniref:WW domain-containing protein n=1 Tax=Ophiocordyceps australis TaxID=1399860 RepID=A0A2C5XWG4_9HYPO|nr:hypothetical protein CDD82_7257 [Ophiocordyceps australis]
MEASPAPSSAPRLKSTYRPSAAAVAAATPLPVGWTEHTAPTGHVYYYNEETKESTYKRPGLAVAPLEPAPTSFGAAYPANVPNLSDPRVANAYIAQFQPQPQTRQSQGGFEGRPRPQPVDKPRRKEAIPGCEPWVVVYTKYSRRFVYNPVKQASYWRIPEKLMPGILELDKARIREKADKECQPQGPEQDGDKEKEAVAEAEAAPGGDQNSQDGSEYEEVEVTDDEADQDEHAAKRQRTGDGDGDGEGREAGAVEFTEADIAAQLQLMGDDYGLEPGDYDDGNMDSWPEGTEGIGLSHHDAKSLFKDLLNDFKVNPYSPWETLLEQGKIIEDVRYTALDTTRGRKDCWDEWSREKIAALKQQRAAAAAAPDGTKPDARAAYMKLLEEKATPKLYWPEFKRKYRKEEAMRELRLTDREREKVYREHIARLRMPRDRLKADLGALLRAQSAGSLRRGVMPPPVLGDVRWISLPPAVRDEIVEAYVQSLPTGSEAEDGGGGNAKEAEARERRERALRERNRVVEEQRRKREREVASSKARLREEERNVEMAMRVDKRGLASQLRQGEDE